MYFRIKLRKRVSIRQRKRQFSLCLSEPNPKKERNLWISLSKLNPFILSVIFILLIAGCPKLASNPLSEARSLNILQGEERKSVNIQMTRKETGKLPIVQGTKNKAEKKAIIFHRYEQKPNIRRYPIGISNENHPIRSLVMGEGEDVILIIASVHGDEKAGTPLVWRLAGYLYDHPHLLRGRKVMLLPMVNPDGGEKNSRYNSRGVDLNRNFSAPNRINNRKNGFIPLSEPETRAIVRAISQCRPNRIITLHQPLACIDYDGPGKDLATHIAKYCDLPVRKLGAMPGSLGSYAGLTLKIPIITLELTEDASYINPEFLWKKYGLALIAAISYPLEPDFVRQTAK